MDLYISRKNRRIDKTHTELSACHPEVFVDTCKYEILKIIYQTQLFYIMLFRSVGRHVSINFKSHFIYKLQCTIPLFINNMYATLQSSTCFEHQHAHLQEDKLYYHSIWYRHSLYSTV